MTYCSQLWTGKRPWQSLAPYRSRLISAQPYRDDDPFNYSPILRICLQEPWQSRYKSILLGILGVRGLVREGTDRHEDATRPKIVGSPLCKYHHI